MNDVLSEDSLEFFLNSMLDSRETRGINDQDNIMQYSLRSISSKEFNHNKILSAFEVICKNETALAETFAFALTQEIMDDIENKTERELFFKPATIISDEAMSFKRSKASFWDANYQ